MTKNSIALNRTLFIEDNLPVLRGIDSKSIDLIATDPPFNKGVGAFTGTTKAGQDVEFKDVWNWNDDVQMKWLDEIKEEHGNLYTVIQAANTAAGNDMGAFICWLAVRMLEMHRVLKDTGSIYLHIDHTAHAYVKTMMDAVFGRKNFRNEIVWGYEKPRPSYKQWRRNHDTILFYTKTKDNVFHTQRVPKLDGTFEKRKPFKRPDGTVWHPKEPGKAAGDWWYDIPSFATRMSAKERTGYPTQKPLKLYARMVAASSNPDDIVLDPFAGCATTCVAAEQLGRRWIGIDIREEAEAVTFERLEREVSENMAWNDIVRVRKEAPERTDDGEYAAPELFLEPSKPKERRISVPEAREALAKRDGLRCRGCGYVPPYLDFMHVDHKKPKKLKGKESLSNFALLCEPCNRKKSYKLTLRELQDERIADGRMEMDWWQSEGRWE